MCDIHYSSSVRISKVTKVVRIQVRQLRWWRCMISTIVAVCAVNQGDLYKLSEEDTSKVTKVVAVYDIHYSSSVRS